MSLARWRAGAATMLLVMLTVALHAVSGSDAAAQTGTPVLYPVAPDPADCVIAPAVMDEILSIIGTPVAASARPEPFEIPSGSPADRETTTAVVATLHQLFACANAGDPLRVASLFTDEFARGFFAGPPLDALTGFLSTPPQPLAEDQKRIIVRIGEVQLLPDGRAGVVIVLDEPDDPRVEEPDYAILKRVDGRWLVDEIHEDGGLTDATPSP